MLSEAQPCLQLLRIGPAPPYNPTGDLYTLLPAGQRCVFRLGRRPDLSDVCLGYGSGGGGVDEEGGGGGGEDLISRLHAELEAERGAEGDWTVHMVDRSTNGTFVNDIRIPKGRRTELADGDTVTFGHPDATNIPEGSLASQQDSEFYFLFQKVTVRPADFDAITTPKVQNPCAFRPVSHADNCISPRGARIRDFTKAPPTSRATLILDSIGSISKLKSQLLTFHPARRHSDPEEGRKGLPTAEGVEWNSGGWAGQGPKRPCDRRETKHRRKAVHRVLPDLEEEIQRFSVEVEQSAAKLRHHKSESDADHRLYRQLTLGVEGREGQGLLSGLKPPLKRRKSEHSERSKHVDDNSGNGNGGDEKLVVRVSTGNTQVTPTGKKRGRPRKHPLGDMSLGPKVMCKVFTRTLYTAEQCAAERCQLPQEDTVEWVQCDDCDNWYHVACAGCNYTAVKEASAEFHCGCT